MALQFQVRISLIIGFTVSDKNDVIILTVVTVIASIILFALSVAAYGVFPTSSHIRNHLLQYLRNMLHIGHEAMKEPIDSSLHQLCAVIS